MKQSHEDNAKELARHYFRLIAEKTGIDWEEENDREIEQMIDAVIAAAVSDAVAELLRLQDRR